VPEAESTGDLVVDECCGDRIGYRGLYGGHAGQGPDFWLGRPGGAGPHWTDGLAEGHPDCLVDPSVGRASLPRLCEVCVRPYSPFRMYS